MAERALQADRLAFFVRTEKERTLVIQNVLTRKIEAREGYGLSRAWDAWKRKALAK